jgi:CelD/BcsL family acetyltransferase involved in cellulose biosynthesis
MYVVRVEDVGGVGRSEWAALMADSSQPNVFLTRPWLEAWRQYATDRDGYLLAARDDRGRLLGVAPLARRDASYWRVREIGFMGGGSAGADHLDLVSASGHKAAVTSAICRYLRDDAEDWDVLRLTDLPQDSDSCEVMQRLFRDSHVCLPSDGAVCPYLPLVGSWETYLSERSSNFRQQIRSKMRRFQKLPGARFYRCQTPQEVARALHQLFRFNPSRWHLNGATSAFSDRRFQAFHRQVADRFLAEGWLDLPCLEVDGQIVAVLYTFVYRNKVYYYNAGFDPHWAQLSLGRVLMAYHIQSAFDRGLDEYDFLRGKHAYKYAWTSCERRNRDVLVLRRNAKTLAWHRIRRGVDATRQSMKHHVPSPMQRKVKRWLGYATRVTG